LPACSVQDAPAQEIEFGSSIPAAFEQLQTVDLAFRLSLAVGQPECGQHRFGILPPVRGEGRELPHTAGLGLGEPGLQAAGRLQITVLPDEGGERGEERERRLDLRVKRAELLKGTVLLRRPLLRSYDHEPRRLRRGHSRRDTRQRRAGSLTRAQVADQARDGAAPAGIPSRHVLAPQLPCVVAATGPAREEIDLVGRERARLADRAPMQSEGPRDGREAHPLVCQALDTREALLQHAARPLAGGRAVQAPAGQGRSAGGGGHDLLDQARVPSEDAQHDIPQVPQEVEPVGDLHSLRCAEACSVGVLRRRAPSACSVGVLTAAVSADHVDAGMGEKPRGQAAPAPIREKVDDLMPLEVNQDAAVAAPAAEGDVVHAPARAAWAARETDLRGCVQAGCRHRP
jgi:hypothetical protein